MIKNTGFYVAVALGVFIVLQVGSRACGDGDGGAETNRTERAIRSAKAIVLDNLKSPSTARFPRVEILDRTRDAEGRDMFLVFLVVDAQNAFGGMVRERFLAVFSLSDEDDDTYFHNPSFSVQSCDDPPVPGVVDLMKTLNGWPESDGGK